MSEPISFEDATAKINEKKRRGKVIGYRVSTPDYWVRLSDVLAVVAGLQRQLREEIEWAQTHNIEENVHHVSFLKKLLGEKRVFGEQQE